MAYIGGGAQAPTDWDAQEQLWHLQQRVAELEKQVAELTATIQP